MFHVAQMALFVLLNADSNQKEFIIKLRIYSLFLEVKLIILSKGPTNTEARSLNGSLLQVFHIRHSHQESRMVHLYSTAVSTISTINCYREKARTHFTKRDFVKS